jgi:hypothetical protein
VRTLRTILGGILLVALLLVAAWLVLPAEFTDPVTRYLREPEMSGPRIEQYSNGKSMRVLFIGNSYTFYNDMPGMIRELAAAAKEERPFVSVLEAPGGFSLAQQWESGRAAKLVDEGNWDYVVLQEQSQRPSLTQQQREREMYPAARLLCARIRKVDAEPVFFLTWAHRAGDRENRPNDTYEAMQKRLEEGYEEIAEELDAEVVSVGVAWQKALAKRPGLPLWADDGSHPSRMGSYLAACMFYAAFYERSPVGNSYTAGLSVADARFFQELAATSE